MKGDSELLKQDLHSMECVSVYKWERRNEWHDSCECMKKTMRQTNPVAINVTLIIIYIFAFYTRAQIDQCRITVLTVLYIWCNKIAKLNMNHELNKFICIFCKKITMMHNPDS